MGDGFPREWEPEWQRMTAKEGFAVFAISGDDSMLLQAGRLRSREANARITSDVWPLCAPWPLW